MAASLMWLGVVNFMLPPSFFMRANTPGGFVGNSRVIVPMKGPDWEGGNPRIIKPGFENPAVEWRQKDRDNGRWP